MVTLTPTGLPGVQLNLDFVGPERGTSTRHYVKAALMVLGVIARATGSGSVGVPARGEIRRQPFPRKPEHGFGLGNIGGKAGHGDTFSYHNMRSWGAVQVRFRVR